MDYNHVMEDIGDVIDAAGVAVIVVGMLIGAGAAVVELSRHETGIYRHFRQQLGRTILLGLELLVVGDIVRTVAAQPTLDQRGSTRHHRLDPDLPEFLAGGRADRLLAMAKKSRPAPSGIVVALLWPYGTA